MEEAGLELVAAACRAEDLVPGIVKNQSENRMKVCNKLRGVEGCNEWGKEVIVAQWRGYF